MPVLSVFLSLCRALLNVSVLTLTVTEKIDINHSTADTIGSIANYLSKHGWVEGLPMLIEADISPAQAAKFGGGTNPRFTWNQLIK